MAEERDEMGNEKFLSYFVAPSLTWMRGYDNLIGKGSWVADKDSFHSKDKTNAYLGANGHIYGTRLEAVSKGFIQGGTINAITNF